MTPEQINLVQKSWEKVEPISEQAAEIFYGKLFEKDPSVESLFHGDMLAQGQKLMAMIGSAVGLLNDLDTLVPIVQKLGERHSNYGVKASHYDTVGAALLETLATGLGDEFTDELKSAWTEVYGVLASTMIDSANNQSDSSTPSDNASDDSTEGNTMSDSSDKTAIFLKGAIEQSGTATLMVDRDLNITYANPATLALLKKHEATFQKKYPGFSASADALIGTCIDSFHVNPAQQRKILDDPSNLPWQADIRIEHLTISLNVTGIIDQDGNYIGNSLEWQDVTEIRAQATLAQTLQGAIDQSGTAQVMIDRDLNITYANDATLTLMKQHEATFQKKYPGFRATADALIGTCIDSFHANPAHQRQLLDDPSNLPWQADIQIEHLSFALNVTAIIDSSGNYTGNCLEWQDVTDARLNQIEVGRLNSAVEGMTTNLMMSDLDGNIVYMNPSVQTMLRKREAQLGTVIPSFSVDKLIGTNYDTFHKNPAHQQNLLGNPANMPYSSDISVAGLEFNLTAIALLDSDGNHVGAAVQWLDITEERDAQSQIENLISAAISGDLEQRIDTSSYDGFMKGLGEGINNLMDNIVEPISSAITVAQSLAQGNLAAEMSGEYGGQFLALSNAMNDSMGNLRNMVTEIRSASTNVFSAAREIAQGNDDLSQRTESQASSLEETASAMEELTTTVQQNAENASDVTKLVTGVSEKATNGGEVVESAVTAMEEINKSSKQISDIIGVIDEIAFQTNLLALNAAVEAARAGEQGRGFAVVAAEVRSLAGRSAAAAKEIKALINDSVEAVGKGTRLVDETGQTFKELVNSVQEVVSMISDIDSASKEQSAGIGEVSQAVMQMDEMTQQNAALVEQASASSKSMEDQAQSLLEQVGFFSTGDEQDTPSSSPAPRAKAPRRPPTKPAATRPAIASDDEWEEF